MYISPLYISTTYTCDNPPRVFHLRIRLAIHHADGGSPGGPREMNPRVPSHLRLATGDGIHSSSANGDGHGEFMDNLWIIYG